ncbi:GPP34 family phosphoprotein [Pseudonocardia alni]|uniref:GOLPH3/VPS74 family protein n=1 Tax=Pseudonocardia alni TaxID=33907 RepID=UPI00279D0C00|nr:GPP34 family phosphoprotein [Pseudonocardia alni]
MAGTELLLAEEVLLVALDDEAGKTGWSFSATAVNGALLCDLIACGAVDVDGRKKVRATGTPPAHPGLREIHELVAADRKQRSISHWLSTLNWKFTRPDGPASRRLVADGVLRLEESTLLGLFTYNRLPEADPGPERALRARLHGVLVGGAEPDAHDALLVTLLDAAHLVRPLLTEPGDRKAGTKRARAIAKGLKDNPVVKAQYEAAVAAAVTSIAVTSVVVTSGSN